MDERRIAERRAGAELTAMSIERRQRERRHSAYEKAVEAVDRAEWGAEAAEAKRLGAAKGGRTPKLRQVLDPRD